MAKAKIQIVWNQAAFGEIRKSPEVAGHLRNEAQAIAGRAGPGHDVAVRIGRTRARAQISTATEDAKREEAVNQSLSKALAGGDVQW